MRSLTNDAYTESQKHLGTEPVIIVKIAWDAGDYYYADRTTVVDVINANGRIIQFSPISSTGKQDSTGEVSSAGIVLDDTDGALKTLVNTEIIEGKAVTVYQHYEGLGTSDLVVLLRGRIIGDIDWSEGERQLSFSVESYIEDSEVGFAPCEDFGLTDQNPDTYCQMWPVVFGTVFKLKGLPIRKSPYGTTAGDIYGGYPHYDTEPIKIENGSGFPQNETIEIVISWTIFRGYFDGDKFIRTASNLPWHTNLSLQARPADDPDYNNRKVAFVADGVNLTGKRCYHSDFGWRRCEIQEGNKAFFTSEFPVLLDETKTFEEVRGQVHRDWYTGNSYLNYWHIFAGQTVSRHNQTSSDLYIVNQYPSTKIFEVYGWRRYGDNDIFVPIPSSYYTKHLSYSYAGEQVTAIEFAVPLQAREEEGWKGDIYVSLRSSLPSNVSDIIKWLFETYTTFNIDTATFNAVRYLTAAFPCGFALTKQENIVSLVEDIAWQARCAIYLRNGDAILKYLSYSAPSTYTLTEEDVLFKSLNLSFTSTEDLITKFIGTWKLDYSERDEKTKRLTYTNNVEEFGLREEEREIYIYGVESLVKMTLYFWGYRYSNSWRVLEAATFLKSLAFEVFDAVTSNIQTFSTNQIKGVLEELAHDSDNNEIAVKLLMASKAGEHFGGEPVEDANFWLGDPAYPVEARPVIFPSNTSEVDYTVPIITDDSTSEDGDPNATKFYYQFILPEIDQEIQRDEDFTVRVELYDEDNKRSYMNVNAVLSLHSEDAADELSTGTAEYDITLSNGSYEGVFQITGGADIDYGFLSVTDEQERDN